MSYATIRAAIKTAMEAVTGIVNDQGKVHEFHPKFNRAENFEKFFKAAANNQVNGWSIARERTTERQQDSGFRYQIIEDILVRGYNGINKDGSSDLAFQDLIDAIKTALRGSLLIWVEQPEDEDNAIQVDITNQQMFGSYLVHYCEMRFRVEEFVIISS